VLGLGSVGLPLAVELARSRLTIVRIDRDSRKVEQINRGQSYIPDVAAADVAAFSAAGRLSATADFSVLQAIDTVNICVPTPLRKTKDPDMSYIVSATEQIAKYLHPGMLIVLESTTYSETATEPSRLVVDTRNAWARTREPTHFASVLRPPPARLQPQWLWPESLPQ
jgi:UDP-N-acetyl-D-glucosamine dehydrogenase